MVGSPSAVIRETRRGQAAFMAMRPEEPPGGSQSVRSSCEAGNDRGAKGPDREHVAVGGKEARLVARPATEAKGIQIDGRIAATG